MCACVCFSVNLKTATQKDSTLNRTTESDSGYSNCEVAIDIGCQCLSFFLDMRKCEYGASWAHRRDKTTYLSM